MTPAAGAVGNARRTVAASGTRSPCSASVQRARLQLASTLQLLLGGAGTEALIALWSKAYLDVLGGAEDGDQVVHLEDEADPLGARSLHRATRVHAPR